jgi:5-(carboxyamino)imidazole ribonucleotide mutase
MPNGITVATVALNAAKNAGLLAARILASGNPELLVRMDNYRAELKQIVLESQKEID